VSPSRRLTPVRGRFPEHGANAPPSSKSNFDSRYDATAHRSVQPEKGKQIRLPFPPVLETRGDSSSTVGPPFPFPEGIEVESSEKIDAAARAVIVRTCCDCRTASDVIPQRDDEPDSTLHVHMSRNDRVDSQLWIDWLSRWRQLRSKWRGAKCEQDQRRECAGAFQDDARRARALARESANV
jgi:hypothetical protein